LLGGNKIKLELLISKQYTKHYSIQTKIKYLFAVIDLDKSKQYPQNFVSVLPKKIDAIVKPSNKFEELFGNESLEVAKQLLETALKSRPDAETAKAIMGRLKLLEPKTANKTKCQNCGKLITQSKRRYRVYKFCYDCHKEGYSKN